MQSQISIYTACKRSSGSMWCHPICPFRMCWSDCCCRCMSFRCSPRLIWCRCRDRVVHTWHRSKYFWWCSLYRTTHASNHRPHDSRPMDALHQRTDHLLNTLQALYTTRQTECYLIGTFCFSQPLFKTFACTIGVKFRNAMPMVYFWGFLIFLHYENPLWNRHWR